jgi:hypothetical protein
LPNYPIVFPNINGISITHLPAASPFDSTYGFVNALPGIARVSPLLGMKNIRVGKIFSF